MQPKWNRSWSGRGSELERLVRPFKKAVLKVNKKFRSKSRRTNKSKR